MITVSKETDKLLTDWYDFRQTLEIIPDAIEATTQFFLKKKQIKFYTDPYDKSTWPSPWELIVENQYCKFNILLGISYTLLLTERYKDLTPLIEVCIVRSTNNVYYILVINDKAFGYTDNEWVSTEELPDSLETQKIFDIGPLY